MSEQGATGEAEDGREDEEVDYETTDALSLDEALTVIGEETRARIVVELGEAVRDDGVTPAAVSFSELMDRVGATDSGRFNYHLDKLVDAFVLKGEEGYTLSPPGRFFYQAIVAGTLTDREQLRPFDLGTCPDCGDPLTVEYPSNHCLYVRCSECEVYSDMLHCPTTGLDDRTREETVDAAFRKDRHDVALLRQAVCFACGGHVEREIRTEPHDPWDELYDYDVYAVLACTSCHAGAVCHPALVAVVTAPVVGFCDDHGADPWSMRSWDDVLVDAQQETTTADDGSQAMVPFDLGGERLRVTLDGDLQVVETERTAI